MQYFGTLSSAMTLKIELRSPKVDTCKSEILSMVTSYIYTVYPNLKAISEILKGANLK